MAITNVKLELGICSLQPTYELRTTLETKRTF